ncbi:MAG: Uma2 family endonuclease [Sandaracinaceae bacterium]|nr:Uma2 family endonuclease [Sandaracinaceae bacterium]
MVAAPALASRDVDSHEDRLVLHGLTYKDYVLISDVLGHRPGLRLTYIDETLEIMTTSPLHEHLKKLIARLLELHALLRGIRILGFGSATYRREDAERGLEPDECYCIGTKKEYPDLAIEVVVTSSAVDKMAVYASLGVREVWVYESGRFAVHELGPTGYELRSASTLIPDLDFETFAAHVAMPDQDDAVRAYWSHLQPT